MPRKKRCTSPFELMDEDFDDNSSQSSRNGNPPVQRNAANARERARMRVLSSAFGRLKTKLPNIPADTKLSKLDTLRLATMYIKQLKSVVEGGSISAMAHGEPMEMAFNNNNSTHCYLNLNTGAQSMNWPFGFHHQLSHTPLIRSPSLSTLINSNSSTNNWCTRDNGVEQMKHDSYDSENYNNHQQQSTSSLMNKAFLNHENSHEHNHWFSETPSPELDTTSNTCLIFENSHPQPQQQQLLNSNHHHQNLPQLPPPASIHSSTFQLQHDFQHHHHHHRHAQQNLPQSSAHHLHHNGFANSSNFQSTSIR